MRCRSPSSTTPCARRSDRGGGTRAVRAHGLGLGVALGICTMLGLGSTLPAHASTTPGDRSEREIPLEPTLVGDAELGIFAESRPDQDVAALSPQVHLGIRPRPEVELELRFGAVAVFRDGPEGRQQQARPSNLSFGAGRVIDVRGDRWRYARIGFSFVLPTAHAESPADQEAYDYALGGRLGWDPWTWIPQTFGLVVPAEVRAQLGRRWVVGADAGLAALLPSADRTDGLALAAQLAAEARLVTRWMGLGMRLSATWNGRHPDDRSQVGVGPFADVSLCRRGSGRRLRGERTRTSSACPAYAFGRLNVNLDGPYGFGEQAMRLWGAQVGLGWSVF